jgi:hypothetical protein
MTLRKRIAGAAALAGTGARRPEQKLSNSWTGTECWIARSLAEKQRLHRETRCPISIVKEMLHGRNSARQLQLEILREVPSAINKLPADQAPPTRTSTGATTSLRCKAILERSQLGEPIANADRVFRSANCH